MVREADEAYLTSYASAPVTEYIHAKGTQSGRSITVGSKKLNLSADNTATNGKDVEVYGFVYGYNSSSSYAYFYATSIAEDPTVPKLSVTPTSKTWASDETDEAVFTVTTNTGGEKDWSVTYDAIEWATIAVDKTAGTITVTPNDANTTDTAREATLTVSHSAGTLSETITLTQKAVGSTSKEPVVIILDAKDLSSTATTADSEVSAGNVTFVLSKGAKQQSSTSATNAFSENASILIGKSGAYIYNKTAIPGVITKFEIYANAGASAKVSVGVNFSNTSISSYSATAANTYTATLSTVNEVYDCSEKLPSDAKYFWYQVTNANNSQVQFRITYIPE